jgi:hypothetical protein
MQDGLAKIEWQRSDYLVRTDSLNAFRPEDLDTDEEVKLFNWNWMKYLPGKEFLVLNTGAHWSYLAVKFYVIKRLI